MANFGHFGNVVNFSNIRVFWRSCFAPNDLNVVLELFFACF